MWVLKLALRRFRAFLEVSGVFMEVYEKFKSILGSYREIPMCFVAFFDSWMLHRGFPGSQGAFMAIIAFLAFLGVSVCIQRGLGEAPRRFREFQDVQGGLCRF